MSDTYSQMYVQVVFAVNNRTALIHESWEAELFKYITGVIKNKGQKLLVINGVNNHIHLLINMKPNCCLSDLVREIKKTSTQFINEKEFVKNPFKWQEGFGAFTYGYSQISTVIQYIENQKNHHKIKTFKDEYIAFLNAFQIEYENKYLFDWINDNDI